MLGLKSPVGILKNHPTHIPVQCAHPRTPTHNWAHTRTHPCIPSHIPAHGKARKQASKKKEKRKEQESAEAFQQTKNRIMISLFDPIAHIYLENPVQNCVLF